MSVRENKIDFEKYRLYNRPYEYAIARLFFTNWRAICLCEGILQSPIIKSLGHNPQIVSAFTSGSYQGKITLHFLAKLSEAVNRSVLEVLLYVPTGVKYIKPKKVKPVK